MRVRYAETDQMGVVYYANYYIYFEIGRVEYMRQLGVAYKEMEIQDDSFIVVAESHCRYLRPARYDDLLRIRTRVAEARRRTIRFAYEIVNSATGNAAGHRRDAARRLRQQGPAKSAAGKIPQVFPADGTGNLTGVRNGRTRRTADSSLRSE